MKDIFEFNHIGLCQNQTSVVSKIFINIITKNTGVLSGRTKDINFLMKHLRCLEED